VAVLDVAIPNRRPSWQTLMPAGERTEPTVTDQLTDHAVDDVERS
jgi:hypothetical protein